MKISHLFYLALLALPLQSFAQFDDMYFASKKNRKATAEQSAKSQDTFVFHDEAYDAPDYHVGALRSDDEYNRRNRPHVYGIVTEGQDTLYYTERELMMQDSLDMMQNQQEDYAMTGRLARFHGGVSSPYYWDYYYDPFYDPWYDPWYPNIWFSHHPYAPYGYYYGNWYGYGLYGYGWVGWRDPWYNAWGYGPYYPGGIYYGGYGHVGGGYYSGSRGMGRGSTVGRNRAGGSQFAGRTGGSSYGGRTVAGVSPYGGTRGTTYGGVRGAGSRTTGVAPNTGRGVTTQTTSRTGVRGGSTYQAPQQTTTTPTRTYTPARVSGNTTSRSSYSGSSFGGGGFSGGTRGGGYSGGGFSGGGSRGGGGRR